VKKLGSYFKLGKSKEVDRIWKNLTLKELKGKEVKRSEKFKV